MAKMVGIAEFKAKCERLISQMEQDGEPIELTRRGKVVGVVSLPKAQCPAANSLFGFLKGTATWASDDDLIRPVSDKPWDAELGIWAPDP